MPRDVIMPALGMSQDSAQIVAWLKRPGDPVRAGDALMEVETDKAVVEVEAQADGFLANVTADAGDQVPVGHVVALIVDTADAIDSPAAADAGAATPSIAGADRSGADADDPSAGLPAGKEIIMPALGMAQDSGLIVRWLKEAGEPVSADDALLEVETDKSVMEIEAGHDGFVAAVLADAQQAVPVGSVIAIISSERPAEVVSRRAEVTEAAASGAPEPTAGAEEPRGAVVADARPGDATNADPAPGGRVLASPKARRLALERGLDLARLVESGVPQPYHVADLDTLEGLGRSSAAEGVSTPASTTSLPVVMQVTARVPASGCDEFIDWMAREEGVGVSAGSVWLRFATAAFRRTVAGEDDRLVVEIRQASGEGGLFTDADRARMSQPVSEDLAAQPDLVLRDFTDSPITSASVPAGRAAALTLGRERDDFVISFDYRVDRVAEDEALRFTTDFAERLGEPLLHLF